MPQYSTGPASDTLVLMGKVFRGHGLYGELKVIPLTDVPERMFALETLYIGADTAHVHSYQVQGGRLQNTTRGVQVLLQLKDVTDRNAADQLRNSFVYAVETDLPLDDDEVFLHDLVGLRVETDAGEPIGHIKDIISAPAQDIYVVQRPDQADALIPAVPDFIQDIDLDAGLIRITPIDGLLD